jgi:hypothetical protein
LIGISLEWENIQIWEVELLNLVYSSQQCYLVSGDILASFIMVDTLAIWSLKVPLNGARGWTDPEMWIKNLNYKWEWTYKKYKFSYHLDKHKVLGNFRSLYKNLCKAKKLIQCLGSKTSLELL